MIHSLRPQVGVPSDRAQYIHRLGRTARAGKEGEGILMLAPYEKYFLKQVSDLPLEQHGAIPIEADIRQEVRELAVCRLWVVELLLRSVTGVLLVHSLKRRGHSMRRDYR